MKQILTLMASGLLLFTGSALQAVPLHPEAAQTLEKRGFGRTAAEMIANPDIVNDHGETPLAYMAKHFSSTSNTREVTKDFLKAGANKNYVNPQTGDSVLITALARRAYAHEPNYDMVDELVEAQVDPNVPDRRGITPLMYAAKLDIADYMPGGEQDALVHQLVKKLHADIHAQAGGKTALEWANERNAKRLHEYMTAK